LHHKTLAVNITGLSTEVTGAGSKPLASLPHIEFASWHNVEKYFLELGAKPETVTEAHQALKKTGFAVLTILTAPIQIHISENRRADGL
jgi:hypothetical protein